MKQIVLLFCIFNLALVQMCWAQSHSKEATILGYTYPPKGVTKTLYLATYNAPKPMDSTICDSMGRFAFKFAVDPANKGVYIAQKDSTGRYKGRISFLLDAGETANVSFLEKDTVTFEGQGVAHYRLINCAKAMSERITNYFEQKDTLKKDNQDGVEKIAVVADFTFATIDSMMAIDPYIALQLVQWYESILFYSYHYNSKHLDKFWGQLDSLRKDYHTNPFFIRFDNQVRINRTAIDFKLRNTRGEDVSLRNYRGRYVLLDFWASWCGPCIEKGLELKAQYAKYEKYNFKILGISTDEQKASWLGCSKKYGFPWEQLWLGSDEKKKKEIEDAYRIYSIPTTILIDPNGIVLKINPSLKEIEAIIMKKNK